MTETRTAWFWVAQGWRTFFGVVSIMTLTNLAVDHGVDWRSYILAIVSWYREEFVPLRDLILSPLAQLFTHWFCWELDAYVLDAITLAVLAFGAANAESLVRHGSPILVRTWSYVSEGKDLFGIPNVMSNPWLAVAIYWLVPTALSVLILSNWMSWGAALLFGCVLSGVMIAFAEEASENNWLAKLYVYAPGFMSLVLLVLLLSPLLAWRTTIVCVSVFGGLLALNELFPV